MDIVYFLCYDVITTDLANNEYTETLRTKWIHNSTLFFPVAVYVRKINKKFIYTSVHIF